MVIGQTRQEEPLLLRFKDFLTRHTGLHFPDGRRLDLLRGIEAATREFGLKDAETCMQWLLATPLNRKQVETLARHLTVGETYFFRDPSAFEALQQHILPALIQSRRQTGQTLRIWSAGCSTGEEAYSLGILIQRLIPDFKQWRITILATDINPQALAKAESGLYGEWSFRNAPDWLKGGYFRPIGNSRYQILASVREMVSFAYLNLMEECYPSLISNTNAMDIILCRNVLMYFEPGLVEQVLQRHSLALVDGGWLITSATEAYHSMPETIETVNFPGAILHRKNADRKTPRSVAPIPQRAMPPAQPVIRPVAASQRVVATVTNKTQPPSYQQALALYRQGWYDKAAAQAALLVADRQHQVQALHLLARIHANQGDLAGARQCCIAAIAADRLDPSGHYLLAVVLLEQGLADDGKQELKRTLYLDPDFILAHFTLGNLYRQQGKDKEARKHFDNARQLLAARPQEEPLPEAEGLTAGRLAEIIQVLRSEGESL